MALAKFNVHGVATSGIETVRVPMPKPLRCHAYLRLAQTAEGWIYGYDFSYPVGGSSAGASVSGRKFSTRGDAIVVGLAQGRRYFSDSIKSHGSGEPGACRAAKRAIALIDQFIARNFPPSKETAVTATLEKSNGHKKATKTPRTKHAAEAPRGRSRKEVRSLPSKVPDDTSPGASAALDHVNADIPPGATSTVLPAGIRRFDPDALEKSAITDPAAITGQEIECDLALLHRHPDNRKSSDDDSDVHSLAESIRIDNLIQAITVRIAPPHWDLPEGHYQIVCGERRWRACRVAGRGSVRCRVRADLDDAATLRIVAAENALRRDLNPIEKAHLIERLCTANEDGSKGLTRDEAAACVGLESGGAASNMARLLNLPEPWQKRIAAGELPWSWAQEIYPYLQAEPVMQKLDDAWKFPSEFASFFTSRKALAEGLAQLTRAYCRRLDAAEFDAAERSEQEVLDELECVELPDPDGIASKRKLVVFATNVKRFDELQARARAAQSKAKASKVGADPERPIGKDLFAATCPPTAAELRAAAKDRADQLTGKINVWRHKLLRHEIARAMEEGRDDGWRLVMCYAAYVNTPGPRFFELLRKATVKGRVNENAAHCWPCVAEIRTEAGRRNLTRAMALMILRDESELPAIDFELSEALAADLGVDLAGAWLNLQATKAPDREARRAMIEEFLLLHRTDELQALAAELGVHLLPSVKTKDQIITCILGHSRLRLPKSIKPLAIAGGKKATKKRRGK